MQLTRCELVTIQNRSVLAVREGVCAALTYLPLSSRPKLNLTVHVLIDASR